MAFFDNFTLIRKKTVYSIKYKKHVLMNVKGEVLGLIIKDFATKKFLKELAGLSKEPELDKDLISGAMVLANAYIDRKRKFFRNNKIGKIKPNTNDFKLIVKASKLIDKHKVSPKIFMDSQIKGLAFLNDGQGSFPTINQLHTSAAEDRLIKEMYELGLNEEPGETIIKVKLKKEDRETPLMENPVFVDYYERIEQKTASLREAYYVHDCMMARKGRATKLILEYIEYKEEEREQ